MALGSLQPSVQVRRSKIWSFEYILLVDTMILKKITSLLVNNYAGVKGYYANSYNPLGLHFMAPNSLICFRPPAKYMIRMLFKIIGIVCWERQYQMVLTSTN
jgi:hypothetical protein